MSKLRHDCLTESPTTLTMFGQDRIEAWLSPLVEDEDVVIQYISVFPDGSRGWTVGLVCSYAGGMHDDIYDLEPYNPDEPVLHISSFSSFEEALCHALKRYDLRPDSFVSKQVLQTHYRKLFEGYSE